MRGGLALAVCLVLVGLIGLAVPGTKEFPRHRDIPRGEWADNSRYAARVADVSLARRVEPASGSYGRTIDAPPGAVAVVVRLDHRVHRETLGVASMATLDAKDGSRARALPSTALPDTGPGFVGSGTLVFIVTEDSAPGARLVLPSQRHLFTGLVVDTLRVDLGVNDATPVEDSVELQPMTRTVAR